MKIIFLFLTLILVFGFQNCGSSNTTQSGQNLSQNLPESPPDTPAEIISSGKKSICEASINSSSAGRCSTPDQRVQSLSTVSQDWDFSWDAKGEPFAHSRDYHSWFDNPYEDDYEESILSDGPGRCKFQFNDSGILKIDRYFYKDDNNKLKPCPSEKGKGWMMYRDPYLEPSSGLVIQFALRLPDYQIDSQKNSIRFNYNGPDGAANLLFSPGQKTNTGCIKISQAGLGSAALNCESNRSFLSVKISTSEWAVYRLVIPPGFKSYQVFRNSSATIDNDKWVFLGSGLPSSLTTKIYPLGSLVSEVDTRNEFPYISFGAFSAAVGAFELDDIRYSRGVLRSDHSIERSKSSRRVLPLPLSSDLLMPQDVEFSDQPNGILKLEKNISKEIIKPKNIFGNGDWNIQFKAKVGTQMSERGFAFRINERQGAVTLVLSKNKVELMMGGKTAAYSLPVYFDTTDQFHVYKLIKYGQSPYVFLYVDSEKRPLISDFKLSGEQFNGVTVPGQDLPAYPQEQEMKILYGWFSHRLPKESEYGPAPVYKPFARVDSHMDIEIDYIRYSPSVKSARTY